ncbi:MAG: hypothetical protein ACI8S6_005638 [Myxococcota bacterium]|jgi:hypothetical protein
METTMRSDLMMLAALTSLTAACGDKDTDTGVDTGATDTSAFSFCSDIIEGFCYLSGEHTDDIELTTDYAYVLDGGVFIGDDTTNNTLSIQPGVTIYGETSTKGFLTIRRNAMIQAVGTAEQPIVFTSPQGPGSRARSDWGGLILNGNAPINICSDGSEDAGDCEAEGEGGTGLYGGTDTEDSSGALQYVRVEFGGTEITTENEVNGIAFQGVGSGTSVSYVQVHFNKDDGVEFYGGTVNADHLVLTGIGDDSLDYTDGWSGTVSDVYIQQVGGYESDRGMEMDNSADQNDALPRSNPTISDVLIVGNGGDTIGFLAREGTAGTFDNINITGSGTCIDVDGDATYAQGISGALSITNSTLDCDSSFKADDDDGDLEAWFLGQTGNSTGSVDATAPDWTSGWIETAEN